VVHIVVPGHAQRAVGVLYQQTQQPTDLEPDLLLLPVGSVRTEVEEEVQSVQGERAAQVQIRGILATRTHALTEEQQFEGQSEEELFEFHSREIFLNNKLQ
jgi:hypothetical protein